MIDRRDFLKRLAATAVVLSLDPYRGIAADGNRYRNARLGLEVVKPKDWEYSSIADFAALRDRQVLQGLLDNENEPHPFKDPNNLPVFLFEEPRHRRSHFAPAITLYDEPLEGPTPRNQTAAHRLMLTIFADLHRDQRVEVEPYTMDVSGRTASIAHWSYLHEIDTSENHPLHIRSILVFKEPRVHTFYLVDDRDERRIDENVWTEFIRSIKYY